MNLSQRRDDIGYALAKHVSDMEHGFRIETNYGSLVIDSDEAQPIAALLRYLLKKKLEALDQEIDDLDDDIAKLRFP
jgi:hypothetical protein